MKRKQPVKLQLNKQRIRELTKDTLRDVGGGYYLGTHLLCPDSPREAGD
jgi:hypothetical protein